MGVLLREFEEFAKKIFDFFQDLQVNQATKDVEQCYYCPFCGKEHYSKKYEDWTCTFCNKEVHVSVEETE